MQITPVILAGGNGSRLWPLSRTLRPKQFLKLTNDKSMLQNTLLRLQSFENIGSPIILCNIKHRFIVADQLEELNITDAQIILEPEARDTAPAIAIASLYAKKNIPKDSILLLLAADHVIKETQIFSKAIETASQSVSAGNILTFGVVPESAHTGYGYIKVTEQASNVIKSISEFVEKPDAETALLYLNSGNYFWNSGMLMFKADTMLKELENYQPSLLKYCQEALSNSRVDLDFIRLNAISFKSIPSISIDYAIMEKSQKVKLIPLKAGWSDVGCWKSLWELSNKDQNNNVCIGDVVAIESTNSYIHAEQKLVTTLGVDNLVIVETKDAILIADINKVQSIKKLVSILNSD